MESLDFFHGYFSPFRFVGAFPVPETAMAAIFLDHAAQLLLIAVVRGRHVREIECAKQSGGRGAVQHVLYPAQSFRHRGLRWDSTAMEYGAKLLQLGVAVSSVRSLAIRGRRGGEADGEAAGAIDEKNLVRSNTDVGCKERRRQYQEANGQPEVHHWVNHIPKRQ